MTTHKKTILVLPHFEKGADVPTRVFVDPNEIAGAMAFGKGRDSGVEFLFKSGKTLEVNVWDTHLTYILEKMVDVNVVIFDRRVEQDRLDEYLETTFNIKPRVQAQPKQTSAERTSRFSSRTQQKRDEAAKNADHGRGTPCSGCEEEFEAEALVKVIDEHDHLLKLCPKCAEEYENTESYEDEKHSLAAAAAAVDEEDGGFAEDEE